MNDVAHDDPSNHLVALTNADKKNYEDGLKKLQVPTVGKKYELVPIWTVEDADGQPKGKVTESVETQGRFRKYAEQGMSPDLSSDDSSLAIIALCSMDRDGWTTGDCVVEGLCQIESKVCTENH